MPYELTKLKKNFKNFIAMILFLTLVKPEET